MRTAITVFLVGLAVLLWGVLTPDLHLLACFFGGMLIGGSSSYIIDDIRKK